MALFEFHDDDIFINTIEGYPEFRFMVHSGSVVIDNVPDMSGSNLSNINDVADGHISLESNCPISVAKIVNTARFVNLKSFFYPKR